MSATHDWFMKVVTEEEGVTYSEIAGLCPIKSAYANKYILVWYEYDSKSILTEALPSRSCAWINKGVKNS